MVTVGSRERGRPSWSRLYETAAAQEGHFTTAQAADAGYSSQLLNKYLQSKRIVRVSRAIYRLVHFPPGLNEDLVVVWLWSGQAGVFSHETALALHQLSDALPAKRHLTVPQAWQARRLHIPRGVILHYCDLAGDDCTWAGAVQVTTAERTVIDCAAAQVPPDLVRQAIDQGLQRGLFTSEMVKPAIECLRRLDSRAH